jgi:hypothetical protein
MRRDLVILACAISAGIHGALAPGHFAEGLGAGLGFAAAVALLVATALAVRLWPDSPLVTFGGAAVFAGLLVSYALATTTGLPVLHPEPEPVDGLGLTAKAVELVGLLALVRLKGISMTTPRTIPLFLATLVAFFSALAALAVSNGHDAHAHDNPHGHAARPAAVTQKQVALRSEMRRLWEDHITWTRLAIISLTTNSPDTEATVGRLLKNQTDIGNAIKPFYGNAAGNRLTGELRKHILIAAEVIAAAKAGDAARLADAQARWSANGDDIAELLASVNPRHWKLAVMKAELRMHLKLTTEEAVARLQGDWNADVAAYDRIHRHALHLSDALSKGLIRQFPRRFR